MTLTIGRAPLSSRPAGATNYAIDGPKHRLLFEDHPRRMRAELGGQVVLDSTRGKLLHESNILPVLYVPFVDLDASALEKTDHSTHCPFKGDASYWTLRVGGEVRPNAVWAYEEPLAESSWLDGYASLTWDAADSWREEDERLLGHIRDPYHRIDVRAAARHVEVFADGELVAQSDHPQLLFETGLPARVYLPREDVRLDKLEVTATRTICPYKGEASYWSVAGSDGPLEDAAWTYEEPLAEAHGVRDLVSFLHDRVEVRVSDGVGAGGAAEEERP